MEKSRPPVQKLIPRFPRTANSGQSTLFPDKRYMHQVPRSPATSFPQTTRSPSWENDSRSRINSFLAIFSDSNKYTSKWAHSFPSRSINSQRFCIPFNPGRRNLSPHATLPSGGTMSSCFHTPPSNKGKVPVFSFSTGNKYSSFLSFLSFQPDGVSCMHVFSSAQLAGSSKEAMTT